MRAYGINEGVGKKIDRTFYVIFCIYVEYVYVYTLVTIYGLL